MRKIKTYSEFLNESYDKPYFLQTRKEINDFLYNSGILRTRSTVYKINDDLTVDVKRNVFLSQKLLELEYDRIPVQFGNVGFFSCSMNKLTSLKGSPYYVKDDFLCGFNNLTSLEYCPTEVGNHIGCNNNKLTSLVFAPKKPVHYNDNPCTEIYDRLGFTTEAHVESMLKYDSDWKGTLEKLKNVYPERYEDILKDKRIKLELGLESEELTSAYNISKNVEGDFY